MSWGPVLDDPTDDAPRRRVGLGASAAVAATLGAGGEITVRAVAHDLAPVWHAARFPLLAALALVVSQLPRRRRHAREPRWPSDPPFLARPRRSALSRHLDRRTRRPF
jgi:hypothetical protein